jgi:hypothetical protein
MRIGKGWISGIGVAVSLCGLATVQSAEGKALRVDDTLDEFQVAGPLGPPGMPLADNGSAGPIPIQSYERDDITGEVDFTQPIPFSIKLFGVEYSEFFINENGTVTFGAKFRGRPRNSDFTMNGVPILAPFFADVDTTLGGSVSHGFFPDQHAIAINWFNARHFGQDEGEGHDFQIVIIEESAVDDLVFDFVPGMLMPGDFVLELNHDEFTGGMLWETGDRDGPLKNGFGGKSARIGVYDGAGLGFEVAGSGVPGALLGDDCINNPTAPACNNYFFQFHGGLPFDVDGNPLLGDARLVSIDILPGGSSNRVRADRFALPVAVLTNGPFDALQVDPSTVTFGPGGTAPLATRVRDVDGDQDADLLFRFRLEDAALPCGESLASLTGMTYGGEDIVGHDDVNVVKCP